MSGSVSTVAGAPVTVTIAGDLFRAAATLLGDATQATRIAQANTITDFWLSGLTAIVVPQINAALTGGVPNT